MGEDSIRRIKSVEELKVGDLLVLYADSKDDNIDDKIAVKTVKNKYYIGNLPAPIFPVKKLPDGEEFWLGDRGDGKFTLKILVSGRYHWVVIEKVIKVDEKRGELSAELLLYNNKSKSW